MSETPQNMTNWLNSSFVNEDTKEGYRSGLRLFAKSVYGHDSITEWAIDMLTVPKQEDRNRMSRERIEETESIIDRYLNEDRVFLDDIKAFIVWMIDNEYQPQVVNLMAIKVKKFFDRNNPEKYMIAPRDWDDIRLGLLPPYIATTQDEIPTPEELKNIIDFFRIPGKSLFLFLSNTGARIGETLQLRISDMNLDADPPWAQIRPGYTKGGVGGRKVWFAPESKDAIRKHLTLKKHRREKKIFKSEEKAKRYDEFVWEFSYDNARAMWCRALAKAGLDRRDSITGIRIYHIHTLRKFFRTQMGDAGMPDMYTHALMGHKAYLADAYDRPRLLAERYKKYQDAVIVYPMSDAEKFKAELAELDLLRKRMKDVGGIEAVLDMIDSNIFNIPESMNLSDKWLFVYGKMRDKWEEK